jgi:hypothetical protein
MSHPHFLLSLQKSKTVKLQVLQLQDKYSQKQINGILSTAVLCFQIPPNAEYCQIPSNVHHMRYLAI